MSTLDKILGEKREGQTEQMKKFAAISSGAGDPAIAEAYAAAADEAERLIHEFRERLFSE